MKKKWPHQLWVLGIEQKETESFFAKRKLWTRLERFFILDKSAHGINLFELNPQAKKV